MCHVSCNDMYVCVVPVPRVRVLHTYMCTSTSTINDLHVKLKYDANACFFQINIYNISVLCSNNGDFGLLFIMIIKLQVPGYMYTCMTRHFCTIRFLQSFFRLERDVKRDQGPVNATDSLHTPLCILVSFGRAFGSAVQRYNLSLSTQSKLTKFEQ